MKKIGRILYTLLVTCLIIIAGLLVVSLLPISNNFQVLVVLSGSMEPTIPVGSVVVVKPAENYQVDDIITFGKISKTQIPTTHRLYEIGQRAGETVFITKGDANNAPDMKEIKPAEVIGKVWFKVPYVGYAVDFAKKPLGFGLIIGIPVAIIIFEELKKIYQEAHKMVNKKKKEEVEESTNEDKKENDS